MKKEVLTEVPEEVAEVKVEAEVPKEKSYSFDVILVNGRFVYKIEEV